MNRVHCVIVIVVLNMTTTVFAATLLNHLAIQVEMLDQASPFNSGLSYNAIVDVAFQVFTSLPSRLETKDPLNDGHDNEAPVSEKDFRSQSGLPSGAAVIEVLPGSAEHDPFVKTTMIELTFNVPVNLRVEDLTLTSVREPRLTLVGLEGSQNHWWVHFEEVVRGDELLTIIIDQGRQMVQYRAQEAKGDSHTLTAGQANLDFAWFDGPGSDPPVVSCCCDSNGICRMRVGMPCGAGETPVACPCVENSCPPTGS